MDNNQNSFIPSNNDFPQSPNIGEQENDMHQHDNAFLNNLPNNNQIGQSNAPQNSDMDELSNILKPNKNKFINNDASSQETSLTSLNIESKIDYSKDPRVQANLQQLENQTTKKNTITIGSEGKIFLIIIALLLVFIFVLPTIFDYIRDIQYK